MRGKIDLTGHKLAGVFRPPAKSERHRRYRAEKMPDATYRQLLRLVDGAVRDCFANHPEYLTKIGRRSAQGSIVKRVAGSLWGYAKDITKEKSFTATAGVIPVNEAAVRGRPDAASDVSAAMLNDGARITPSFWMRLALGARSAVQFGWVALGGRISGAPADNLSQRISDTHAAMKAVDHG